MVTQTSPWDTFSSPQEENRSQGPNIQLQESSKQKEQKFSGDWGSLQDTVTYQGPDDPIADEAMFDYLVRGGARLGSRGAEQFLGAPGNYEKFGKDTLKQGAALKEFLPEAIQELIGPMRWDKLTGGLDKQVFGTSAEYKALSQKLTKGYTSPKTKGEAELDELTEDVTATLIRGRAPAGRLTNFNRAANHLLIPTAANLTKKLVNDLGFGEDAANLAKMAVWLPLSMANNINASRYAADLMNSGRQGFNPNLQANVPNYQRRLDALSRQPNMLANDTRSDLARQQIAGIQEDIANGQTSIQALMSRYDAINAAKRNRGLFQLGGSGDRDFARARINDVLGVVRNEIETLGQNNPQALQDWQNGLRAYAAIHQSNAVTNRVEEWIKGPYGKMIQGFGGGGMAAILGIGAKVSPIITGSGGAAVAAGYKGYQVMSRMLQNPDLYRYYWDAIQAVTENNLPVFLNNFNKFNKKIEKEDKENLEKEKSTKNK